MTALFGLPDLSDTWTVRLGTGPGAVREARHAVAELVGALGADAEACDTCELLTSEVVTNAVRYGLAPYDLVVRPVEDGFVRIEVYDLAAGAVVPRPPDLWSESGRGLHMVSVAADRWGCAETRRGKCVWFEVPLHSA